MIDARECLVLSIRFNTWPPPYCKEES